MIVLNGNDKLNNEQLKALVGKIKVVVYTRVSTDDQARHGYSLESQMDRCVTLAKTKHNCFEDEIIVLIEAGEHGDDPNRPALNYAIFLLSEGIGKMLMFLHPDRLSRHLYLQQEIAHRVWGAGCDLVSVEMDLDKNNPESMLMFNIQGSIAQYNKAKILANSKRGRKQKAKNGMISGMRRLYGYTFDKEKDTLTVNKEEANALLLMIDLYLNQNYSLNSIAKELSVRGIQPPNGVAWYQTTVSRILRNESYTGKFYYGKTEVVQNKGKSKQIKKNKEDWILINIPPIFDEQTHAQIVSLLETTKAKYNGKPSDDYLIRKVGRCGRCGGAIASGITTKTKNGLIKYYTCVNKSAKGFISGVAHKSCQGKNWRVDFADEAVWEHVRSAIENPIEIINKLNEKKNNSESIIDLTNKKKELYKIISEKVASRERYIDLYASGMIREKSDLEIKLNQIDEQTKRLKSDLLIIEDSLKYLIDDTNQIDVIKKKLSKYQKIINSPELLPIHKKEIISDLVIKAELQDSGKINVVMILNDEPTTNNIINGQGDGGYIYVSSSLETPDRAQWGGGKQIERWDNLNCQLDKLKELYYESGMTFLEIEKKTGYKIWDIKKLFYKNGLKGRTFNERILMGKHKKSPSITEGD